MSGIERAVDLAPRTAAELEGHSAEDVTWRINLRGAALGYGRHVALQVRHLTFTAGERVALLGVNGAGKSTLLRTLAGDLPPLSGECSFRGGRTLVTPADEPSRRGHAEYARLRQLNCGIAPELSRVTGELTGLDLLRAIEALGRRSTVARAGSAGVLAVDTLACAIDVADAAEFVRRPMRTLSKGQRQRILVAAAWVGRPDMILLDEPESGLDPLQRERLALRLRAATVDATLIVATHDLSFAHTLGVRTIMLGRTASLEPTVVCDEHAYRFDNVESLKEAFAAAARGGLE